MDYIDSCKVNDESINDYVHIINIKSVEFSNDKLEEFQIETLSDPVLNKIMEYYKS